MKPQLLGFHHIAIIASNYARSKHFYMDILGAKQLNETYRAERDSYKLDLSFPDGSPNRANFLSQILLKE